MNILTVIPIVVAIISYFHSTGLPAIQPGYSLRALGNLGGILDRTFPTINANDQHAHPEIATHTLSSISTAAVSTSSPKTNKNGTDQNPITADDEGALDLKILNQYPDPNEGLDLLGLLPFHSLIIGTLIRTGVLVGIPLIFGGILYILWGFWENVHIINTEIMQLTNEILSWKAALRRRFDMLTSIVDGQLDQLMGYMLAERQRVYEELTAFNAERIIGEEIETFQESLELCVKEPLERQVFRMNEYLRDLRQACREIPDLAGIRKQYDELQGAFQESKGTLDDATKQLDSLLVSINEHKSKVTSLIDDGRCTSRSVASDEKPMQDGQIKEDRRDEQQNGETNSLSRWVRASPEGSSGTRRLRRARTYMRSATRISRLH